MLECRLLTARVCARCDVTGASREGRAGAPADAAGGAAPGAGRYAATGEVWQQMRIQCLTHIPHVMADGSP
ncbi:jg20231 [Pararge aegeria aegeria]|uniref:Jg20231 protein n=1 Tax=Pararge aegeria aegeria TaxID=348720 RepID=A0A8S4R8E1_9NEOP|nr:jg20231 [Pararge aegeria aegeria]